MFQKKIKTRFLALALVFATWSNSGVYAQPQTNSRINIPSLGETSSSTVTLAEERQIGQAWLSYFRAQTPLYENYLVQTYFEDMVKRLIPYANLSLTSVDLVVVDNPAINAFAVPGGVVGANNGLLLAAKTESEVAAVMAHELAHLSQRHFARSMEQQKSSTIVSLAGFLATAVLAAAGGGDAALAMLSVTQAGMVQSQLNYSRQNEQEADRIGIQTLYEANFDPAGASRMFERMLASTSYTGQQVPEYLRSHPLTESRINDSAARARQYPTRFYPQSELFEYLRVLVDVEDFRIAAEAVNKYRALVETNLGNTPANRLGLATALIRDLKPGEALPLSEALFSSNPNNPAFVLLLADALAASGEISRAIALVNSASQGDAGYHPYVMKNAELLQRANRYEAAAEILSTHVTRRPKDPAVWYQYAEIKGLSGDILGVHLARAEYFLLVASYDRAIQHYRLAKEQIQNDPIELAVLDQKISRAVQLRSSDVFGN